MKYWYYAKYWAEFQDKLTGENHLVTSQELKINTQKCRLTLIDCCHYAHICLLELRSWKICWHSLQINRTFWGSKTWFTLTSKKPAGEKLINQTRITINCWTNWQMLRPGCRKLTGTWYVICRTVSYYSLVVSFRRVEELVDNQSRRWEEFCRMANNMKSLSADMIQQVSSANLSNSPHVSLGSSQ